MTREEEIIQAADECYPTWEEHNAGFYQGAKWADQHPRKGLVDTKKVEQWIIECFAFLNDAGHHHFKVDRFIKNFRIAMED